jgi:alginate O-acetyltransferase complex protein AlgI
MSLSEPTYIAFLLVVFVLYYLVPPGRPRGFLLLGASYLFYFLLSGYYLLILLFVTAATYGGGLLLGARADGRGRGSLFSLICLLVLTPLVIFKYLGFLLGIAGFAGSPLLHLVIPVGLSFFTFAALGYLIDVYLQVSDPARHPLDLALFLAFFPIVTAGPIERAERFLPQLDLAAEFSSDRALAALRLIFIGLFLKVWCADALIKPADTIFNAPSQYIPLEQLFGVIFYVFYIYADFAGYSLIAIGSALMFGLEVRPNFRQPFLSSTIPDFWRTWHISLSSWVRDYLFAPLRMQWRYYGAAGMGVALFLSFIVIGIWHGAAWGFIVFGVMHGIMVLYSTYTLAARDRLWSWLRMPRSVLHIVRAVVTFLMVTLTFVAYRANSLADARAMYHGILSAKLLAFLHGPATLKLVGSAALGWKIILLIIAGDILARRGLTLEKFPVLVQIPLYNIGAALIVYGWVSGNASEPFLYYKF